MTRISNIPPPKLSSHCCLYLTVAQISLLSSLISSWHDSKKTLSRIINLLRKLTPCWMLLLLVNLLVLMTSSLMNPPHHPHQVLLNLQHLQQRISATSHSWSQWWLGLWLTLTSPVRNLELSTMRGARGWSWRRTPCARRPRSSVWWSRLWTRSGPSSPSTSPPSSPSPGSPIKQRFFFVMGSDCGRVSSQSEQTSHSWSREHSVLTWRRVCPGWPARCQPRSGVRCWRLCQSVSATEQLLVSRVFLLRNHATSLTQSSGEIISILRASTNLATNNIKVGEIQQISVRDSVQAISWYRRILICRETVTLKSMIVVWCRRWFWSFWSALHWPLEKRGKTVCTRSRCVEY